MICDITLLATVSNSDAIPEIWHWIAWVGLILSVILAILSLIQSFIPHGNKLMALWFAMVGSFISLYPVLFVLHIYRIDYIAVGGDGTSASPPLISVLIWPLLPFIGCLLAAVICYFSVKRIKIQTNKPSSSTRQGCSNL
jgi:hypothetical protein